MKAIACGRSTRVCIFGFMIEVNIIGTGNVAWHLARAMSLKKDITIKNLAGRSKDALQEFKPFAQKTVLIKDITPAQVNIIAVSDDSIADVATSLPFDNGLVVHTSGFTNMLEQDPKVNGKRSLHRNGVFYPLQSFSKGDTSIEFTEIPILIEGHSKDDEDLLRQLGEFISDHVEIVNSKQRKQLHLAAVFANNFGNHLYTIAQELCEDHQVSFGLLHCLIATTASKAITNGPKPSQTGPAKRGDEKVIQEQLKLLKNSNHTKIYRTFTDALKTTYGKEL